MSKSKYYPIRVRNEKEREVLDEYLELCRKNNSDGSTEIRKFMKRYIARYRNKVDDNKVSERKGKITLKNESPMQGYLKKIGYKPSYLK